LQRILPDLSGGSRIAPLAVQPIRVIMACAVAVHYAR